MMKYYRLFLFFMFSFVLIIGAAFAQDTSPEGPALSVSIADLSPQTFEHHSDLRSLTIKSRCSRDKERDPKARTPIPESIGNLTQLRHLTIGEVGRQDCFISTTLPASLGKLTKLRELNIDDSVRPRKTLPDVIGKLSNLEHLLFNRQDLPAVPEQIRQLKKLKTLDLSLNNITELPEWLADLNELEKITLDFNNIKTLPASLNKLLRLKEISLENNSLSLKIQATMKQTLPKIKLNFENEYEDDTANEAADSK